MSKNKYLKSCNIFYCGKEKCKPSHSFGPHTRNHFLLHFVESGKGIYKVNEEE